VELEVSAPGQVEGGGMPGGARGRSFESTTKKETAASQRTRKDPAGSYREKDNPYETGKDMPSGRTKKSSNRGAGTDEFLFPMS